MEDFMPPIELYIFASFILLMEIFDIHAVVVLLIAAHENWVSTTNFGYLRVS